MEGLPTKPRPISVFMTQELMHDYVSGNLDKSRREAVEQSLAKHPELQKDLELYKAANDYCDQLSKTKVSSALLEELGHTESLTGKISGRLSWSRWPDAMKWTTEALVLSTMVIMFTIVTPWEDIKSWVHWEAPEPAVIVEPEIIKAEEKIKPPDVPVKEIKPAAKKVVAVAAKPAPPKPTAAPAKPQGVLHRMVMKVPNIEQKSAQVTEKILSLGGKKAGRVRLGWRKPTGNYYHFSISKNKQTELANTLGELGPVRIYQHPHERVMPEGIIRIILFVEDGPVEEPVTPTAPLDSEVPAEPATEAPTDEQRDKETEQEEA